MKYSHITNKEINMWEFVYLFVVFGAITGSNGSLEDGACCGNNSLIVERQGLQFCWNKETNKTEWTHLKCNTTMIRPHRSVQMTIEGGKLLLPLAYDNVLEYEPGTFCTGDALYRRNGTISSTRAIVYCNDMNEKPVISDMFKGIASVISAIFLLATALIYAVLPEVRDLLGKSIINLCVCLAIGLLLMAAMNNVEYSDMDLCAARGFFMYFFFMASFFWMNAIALQILFGFRRPTVNSYSWKEFSWYALYSWGCPTLLTVILAVVNYVPGRHQRPGIGHNNCWFYNIKIQWQYMYSVMTVLYLINISIFIYTSVLLWRQKFHSDHTRAMKFRITIMLRLFVVMGIFWVFEMIESAFPTHIVWEILDIINMLQGLFIFLMLVVFRKRTVKAMHKHGWLDCISGPVERWLAVGEDEEDMVQHTVGVSMDDTIKVEAK